MNHGRLSSLSRLLVALAVWASVASNGPLAAAGEPVPLIFDTDMGNDIDDALALGMIHAFESLGECKLLAVTVTKDNPYAAAVVDQINTFYGRPRVPIGVVRGGVTREDGAYLRGIATSEDAGQPRYPKKLRDGRDAPEATRLLRQVLAGQPDGSTTIVQVGFSTNLARLLDSKPDDLSPLDGVTLVRKKVRLLSAMAGKFVSKPGEGRTKEYNVVTDLPAAKQVFARWPTPVVLSGAEIGDAIYYPSRSIEQDYRYVAHHPLAEAYRLYMKMPYDRQTWDLTAVLYAVRPAAGYFGLSPEGQAVVEDDGWMGFEPAPGGLHRYLTLRTGEDTTVAAPKGTVPFSSNENRDSPPQALRVREMFIGLCSRRPDGIEAREREQAEAARKVKMRSTRTQPEPRVVLENAALRLDFDPRDSDTAYNYIWLRRPGSDQWLRVHNFGVDVRAYESRDRRVINCVGMGLSLKREGNAMRVLYPSPLIQYRQFDDKIGSADLIRRYPDIPADERKRLVHADAAVEFRYEIDPERPSFVASGRVVEGRISDVTYIIDALWTDNHALPTHELIEGHPEIDIARPEAAVRKEVPIEKESYAIFYRRGGDGVPVALLPLRPVRAVICNYFDNWKCLYDFRGSGLNQQFIPDDPPVIGSNDAGYLAWPQPDGVIPGVRVVFFPELGWGQGGKGQDLRDRIVKALEAYSSRAAGG